MKTHISVVTTAWVVVGMDSVGLIRDDAAGGTHLVQIVEMDVLRIVDRVVVTCVVGFPPVGGVLVLVTGQEVTVVRTLVDESAMLSGNE